MTPYKGWSSYETWLAKVWLDNEPLTKRYWQIAVRDTWATAVGSHICTRSDRACVELAQRLKLERQAAANELLRQVDATMSFWADLIHSSLSNINWLELADALLSADIAEYEQNFLSRRGGASKPWSSFVPRSKTTMLNTP